MLVRVQQYFHRLTKPCCQRPNLSYWGKWDVAWRDTAAYNFCFFFFFLPGPASLKKIIVKQLISAKALLAAHIFSQMSKSYSLSREQG